MTYKTSQDYGRLIELLDDGNKIFGYLSNEAFQCYQNNTLGYELESIYEWAENLTASELLKFCEENDIEFIDPADYCDKKTIAAEISCIQAVLDESDGVAGWHKNGKLAEWHETGIPDSLELIRVQLCYYTESEIWHSPDEIPEPEGICLFILTRGIPILVSMDKHGRFFNDGYPALINLQRDVAKWAYVLDLVEVEK